MLDVEKCNLETCDNVVSTFPSIFVHMWFDLTCYLTLQSPLSVKASGIICIVLW